MLGYVDVIEGIITYFNMNAGNWSQLLARISRSKL